MSVLLVSAFVTPQTGKAEGDFKVFLPMVLNADSGTKTNPYVTPVSGDTYYVAPNGSSNGKGSISQPWDLQTALNQPSVVEPGDIIWLRGGRYTGQYVTHLKGEASRPIVVRQYPGERAILDNTGLMLDIQDSWYVDFWGFEITSSNNTRDLDTDLEWAYGVRVHQGRTSHNIRFINLVIHDVASQGFGWWVANTDAEIYGSLIYYNGKTELDHGIYVKNQSGTKTIADNFIFDNASHGVHGYSSTDDTLNNFVLEGNTLFNNGSVGYNTSHGEYGVYKRNILLGGNVRVNDTVIRNNYTYYPGTSGESLNLGYNAGSDSSVVSGNYLMGGSMVLGGSNTNLTMNGNTIYGSWSGVNSSYYSNNTFSSNKPSGVRVFVRPNEFEANRANVTVYNWDRQTSISISANQLSGLNIQPGDTYELRNVQDYFNDVITGTYNGSSITIPMTGHSVAQPVGLNFKPAGTFPEFGGFVLIVTG